MRWYGSFAAPLQGIVKRARQANARSAAGTHFGPNTR